MAARTSRGGAAARAACAALLLLAVAATVRTAAADPVAPAEERLQFADGLYTRGMYDMAIKEYLAFLAASPNGDGADAANFRLGECYMEKGDHVQAEQAYRRVYTDFPQSKYRLQAGFKRADIFMQIKRYDGAIDLYGQVLTQNPPPDLAAASLYFQGVAYLNSGDATKAAANFEKVRAEHKDSRYLAYAVLELGQIRGLAALKAQPVDTNGVANALALYGSVQQKPPSDRVGAEAMFQIAELLFQAGRYTESARGYKELMARYPADKRSREARLQASWAAYRAGLYVDARQLATDALKQPPPDKDEWLYLKANCERQLVEYAAAVKTYAELIDGCPQSSYVNVARYEQALSEYKLGHFAEAIAGARRMSMEGELKKDVYWLLAESYAALKDTDNAVQYYRLLCREFPDSDVSGDAMYRLAHHLQERGEYQEAARFYGNVARQFPRRDLAPKALFASAFCLAKAGMHAESSRDWTALIQTYPQSPLVEEALYQKAMSEIRLRRDTEAMTALRDLQTRFPESTFVPESHYWLGTLLSEQDKSSDAENEFRAAIKSGNLKQDLQRKAEYNLAVVLQKQGKQQEAADRFQALLDSPLSDSFTAALLEWLAGYRYQEKRYDDCIKAAQQLVAKGGTPDWQQIGWGLTGRAELALKHNDKAEDAFRKCLDILATTSYAPEAALRLGELRLAANDLAAAKAYFERAAAKAGGDALLGIKAHAYAGLGRTAEAGGDHDNASRLFMSVAILYDDPELVPECLYRAAKCFEEMGKNDERNKALEELRRRYPNSAYAKPSAAAEQQNG